LLSITAGVSNHGVPKIGTDFLVANVEIIPDNGIRVWFTRPPVVGTGKATDIASYSITGPGVPTLKYATATTTSTKAVNLYFTNSILAGQYTLSFNSTNILSNDADSIHLAANTQYIFTAVNSDKLIGDLDTDLNLTRKFLNPAFLKKSQPNWEATVAALEDNRISLTDTVNKIFNQCFISSANSKYLITRASDNGISHPSLLGLADDTFRNIAITLLNDKLTLNANLDLLELLYGADATRANLTSAQEEPYCLFDGATLNILVDKKLAIPVVFSWSDFVNPLLATAEEVAFVVNRYLKIYNSTSFAVPYTDLETGKIYVKLFSGTKGLHSAISVTSGSSQLALQFDSLLFRNIDTSVSPSVTVTIDDLPLNKALITITKNSAETIKIFKDTLVGDYVNIIGSDFNVNNRGSFIIEEVNQDAGTFTIANKTAVHEVVAPHANSITIYHPVTKQVTDNVNYAYSTNNSYKLPRNKNGYSKASIPVNTEIIVRSNDDAAYLPSCAESAETAVYRRPDGRMSTTVAYPTNTFVEITEFLAKLPTTSDFVTTAGAPATPSSHSGTSDLSMFSRTFADTFLSSTAASTMPLCIADLANNVVVIGGEHVGSHTGTNSISVCKINTKTVDANLNFQFTYTWTKTLTTSGRFTWGAAAALIDYPRFWNNILIVGGYPNGTNHATGSGYAENRTCLYNAETNAYQEIGTTTNPGYVADAALVWMKAPYNKAVVIGGHDNTGAPIAKCSVWDPSFATSNAVGKWYQGAGTELKNARTQCQAIDLEDGRVLVIGGKVTSSPDTTGLNIEQPLNSCEIISPTVDFSIAPALTAPMGHKRFGFGLTKLPNGNILVAGGIGYLSNKTVATSDSMVLHELKACEVYDPNLNIWYSVPEMLEAHSYCDCLYDAAANRVYVCGGATSTAVEYLDLETMTWHYSTAILPRISFRGRSAITTGNIPIIVRPSGSIYSLTTSLETESGGALLIPLYNETARSNGINGIHKAIGSADYQCRTTGWTKSDTAGKSYQITAIAESRDQIGPYIYDPGQIFGFAEKELTTATEIPRGKGCPAITTVEDISSYDKTGLLVVRFGYEDQAGPVSYFVSEPNTLELDPAFNFNAEYPAGVTLTIATQKAPYMPTVNVQKGALWITASNAGLAIARQYIEDISAAGLDLIIKVRYPGDRGLGNEGKPVDNNYKLSDIIEVFGPDDDALDGFLKEQRNGG
jgi:hypothetical protein